MNDALRLVAAGTVGSVVTLAALSAPPVLADAAERAAQQARGTVTSAQIKNGTVRAKDLSPAVAASLGRADTALQEVPVGSVTTDKLGQAAVTEDKLADQSVGSAQVRPNSLAAADLAAGSVGASEVDDGSLTSADVSSDHGTVEHDFGELAPHACDRTPAVAVSGPLTGDLVLTGAPASVPGVVTVHGRAVSASALAVWVCNTSADPIDLDPVTWSYAVVEN